MKLSTKQIEALKHIRAAEDEGVRVLASTKNRIEIRGEGTEDEYKVYWIASASARTLQAAGLIDFVLLNGFRLTDAGRRELTALQGA